MKKHKITKSLVSCVLAFVMILGMIPLTAFATDTTYTVTLAVNRADLGSVSGDGEYANGAVVALTATANYDNVFFAYWIDSSVTLSEEPIAAELEAAIVSYDSTYTFTAAKDISLTAVFAYNSYVGVNGIAYANEDEIFSGEGSGTYIEEIETMTEIGKQSVTISASDYDEFVTIDDVVYERNCMFTWTYDQTTEQITYTTHDSFAIPVAPLYDSVEYWAYLAEYAVPVTVAYIPHTHSYTDATCTEVAVCDCGATTGSVDSTNHTGGTEVRGQKDAAEFEDGYTGDTYCLGCNTMIEQGEVIGATHVHSYSAATCSTPATCSCGATTGSVDPTNHTGGTEVRNQKDAAEFEDGYTGDTYCLGCDTKLADGEVIGATHTHSYTQATDGDNHWDVCSCGDKKDEAAHEWTYTYDDDIRHTMACTVCEYEAGGAHGIIKTMVDDNHHWWNLSCCGNEKNKGSHTYDNAYATQCNATFGFERCTYDRSQSCTHSWGNYSNKNDVHEKTCSKCGLTVREDHTVNTYKWIDGKEIAAAHTEVCVCGKSWDVAHTWTQASTHSSICTECNYYLDNHTYTAFKPSEANPETYHVLHCSVCGEMSDPVQVAGHNYEVKSDKTGHWNQCIDCGYTTAKTAHQMTVAPNDGDDDTHIVSCGNCEYAEYEDCVFDAYDGDEDYHWTVCSACGDTPSRIGMQAHVDGNSDGTCDVCNEKYTPPHTHSYKDKYDSTGHYTECDCGEKTEVQAHSYTGMFDSTCDCGYDRGLFKVGTVDTDYVEVGFIPGDGVTLPDDAELVVEDHYPSLAPIASTIVKKTSLGDLRCPEEYDTLTDEDAVLIYGIKCKLYETLVIGGKEYILWGSSQDGPVLLSLPYGLGMVYNRETGIIDKYRDSSFDRKVEKPTNTTVTIDGVTYDVACIVNNSTYILYWDGQLAGMYPSTDVAAELHGSVQFYEGYDPETLKAQQDDNDLGSVTIPADYNNAAIADFAPGKTYKVSVIGSNDISVKGYDDALLNSITGDTPEIAAAKAEVERLKADRAAKAGALAQMDANHPDHLEASVALYEAEKAYKEALASLADLTNLQGATVIQTFKIPDALVGAKNVKYVGVHDTNPYAAQLAEAEQAANSHLRGSTDDPDSIEYYHTIQALYDAWEEEHGSSTQFGELSISQDGKTVTATYAVDSFSPFIVYAFVEADEPEYKELSATLHTEHTGGTATCKTRAVCEICGESYGDLAAHTYENGTCAVCGEADPDTGLPQTGYSSVYNYIMLAAAAMVLFGIYAMAKSKRKEEA